MKVTPIVQAVYVDHLTRFGEPDEFVQFKNADSVNPLAKVPPLIHIGIWDAGSDEGITTFATIGMSEGVMIGCEHRAELHLNVRGKLDSEIKQGIIKFLANCAAYPFLLNAYFDWWKTFEFGELVGWPNASAALLFPPFMQGGWESTTHDGQVVKILNLVPISRKELNINNNEGRDSLLDYWDAKEEDLFSRFRLIE